MFDLLCELAAIHAFSGREQALADHIYKIMEPISDEIYIDRVGNVVCRVDGDGEDKKKLMFAAHMDEVGMIVTYIEPSGYIRFTNNGGPNWASAAYREVVFESGVRGMLVPQTGCDGNPSPERMYVDIGARDKEDAEQYVEVGDCFAADSRIIRTTGTCVAGRPVDNRIGCAILIKSAQDLKARGRKPYHDVYFVFTVQEEIALPDVGASVASYEIQPDIGIAVDVCATGDTIGALPMAVSVGEGAAIHVRDTTIVADKELVDHMKAAAKENNIPYQLMVSHHGGNDAVPMQKTGLGCKAGVISIPMRYLHTSAETADLDDAEACRDLAVAMCDRPMKTAR